MEKWFDVRTYAMYLLRARTRKFGIETTKEARQQIVDSAIEMAEYLISKTGEYSKSTLDVKQHNDADTAKH